MQRALSKSKPKLNYVKEFMNKFLFYASQIYSRLLFESLNLKGYNMYIQQCINIKKSTYNWKVLSMIIFKVNQWLSVYHLSLGQRHHCDLSKH